MRVLPARVWRLLQSRRLAVSLIVSLAAYGIVGTLVPRGAPADSAVRSWADAYPVLESVASPLGLHRAYSSPLFLTFAVLLAACTGACAVERTRRALRIAREMRESSEGALRHLRTRPQVAVCAVSGTDSQTALATAEAGIRTTGLRVHRRAEVVEALSGGWGVFGSPLFHWAIVALMVAAAAGQATRAEGFIELPADYRRAPVRVAVHWSRVRRHRPSSRVQLRRRRLRPFPGDHRVFGTCRGGIGPRASQQSTKGGRTASTHGRLRPCRRVGSRVAGRRRGQPRDPSAAPERREFLRYAAAGCLVCAEPWCRPDRRTDPPHPGRRG
jgi:hypothetical protein